MSQGTDLYTILRFYANRTRKPDFTVGVFISFLEKYARKYEKQRPDIGQWSTDTGRKIWTELPKLEKEGRIQLHTNESGTSISIPQFYVDLIQNVYRSADENAELPFPDESSLRIQLPHDQVKSINLEMDLPSILSSDYTSPAPILKISFPESTGTAIILASMVPKRLLELALMKIRHYLRSHNNKEYIQHKLMPAFQGKESQLKEALNQILIRPFDTMTEMEKSGDFVFSFWAYFSSMVKNDIRKKNDKLPEDTAALQSVFVIEFMNNFYRGKATKAKESETALKNLENQLNKPPFLFTIDDISRFTDTKGVPLLGQYSRETLEEHLKKISTSAEDNQLPDLLTIHGLSGERWFIKKKRVLPLCVRLLGEARIKVKPAISQRWFKLMKEYRTERSMEEDEAFDKELAELVAESTPELMAILNDEKLYLVYMELEGSENGIPEAGRLFYKGMLAPMSELMLLKRKDLLTDVKMLLPFWYSMPVFSKLIAFFKQLGRKDQKKKTRKISQAPVDTLNQDQKEVSKQQTGHKDRRVELKKTALEVQTRLIPPGYSAEEYLDELRDRWNRLISTQTKDNLTEDVNSLIRDYLRRTIRSLRSAPFTPERIAQLADTLSDTPNLQKLPAKDSLRLYIQLYITVLLMKA